MNLLYGKYHLNEKIIKILVEDLVNLKKLEINIDTKDLEELVSRRKAGLWINLIECEWKSINRLVKIYPMCYF